VAEVAEVADGAALEVNEQEEAPEVEFGADEGSILALDDGYAGDDEDWEAEVSADEDEDSNDKHGWGWWKKHGGWEWDSGVEDGTLGSGDDESWGNGNGNGKGKGKGKGKKPASDWKELVSAFRGW